MTRARVLSARLLARDLPDCRWELAEDLIVDLGTRVHELHRWQREHLAAGYPPKLSRVAYSDTGSTLLTVFAGLVTDFSSIPILAQLVMGPKDSFKAAGAAHDPLYFECAPRDAADLVWWIVARAGHPHVSSTQAWLGYRALRLFGGLTYGRYQRARG